jgi:sec-independent protein translocase protein TatB
MFDFDVGKLLLIGVVALIFIPPKDLPNALRQLGRILGQARRMAADFQGQFSEAMREAELSQIKDEFQDLKQKASVEDAFSHVADMLETKVEAPKASPEAVAEAEAALAAAPVVAETPAPAPELVPMPQPAPIPLHEPDAPEPAPLPRSDAAQPGQGKTP